MGRNRRSSTLIDLSKYFNYCRKCCKWVEVNQTLLRAWRRNSKKLDATQHTKNIYLHSWLCVWGHRWGHLLCALIFWIPDTNFLVESSDIPLNFTVCRRVNGNLNSIDIFVKNNWHNVSLEVIVNLGLNFNIGCGQMIMHKRKLY